MSFESEITLTSEQRQNIFPWKWVNDGVMDDVDRHNLHPIINHIFHRTKTPVVDYKTLSSRLKEVVCCYHTFYVEQSVYNINTCKTVTSIITLPIDESNVRSRMLRRCSDTTGVRIKFGPSISGDVYDLKILNSECMSSACYGTVDKSNDAEDLYTNQNFFFGEWFVRIYFPQESIGFYTYQKEDIFPTRSRFENFLSFYNKGLKTSVKMGGMEYFAMREWFAQEME